MHGLFDDDEIVVFFKLRVISVLFRRSRRSQQEQLTQPLRC